jgi:S1-C subfamily serine protease
MRPRTLFLTLLLVTGFWFVTSHGDWTLARLVRPLSSGSRLWSEPVTARGAGFLSDEQNNIDIYKANRLATVNITSVVYQRDFFFQVFPQKGIGSGFIINESGEIVTNYHVITGSRNITVTLPDEEKKSYPATVLGIDRRADFALLQIHADHKLPFVRLGNSDNLVVGQKVLAIGNPFGLGGTLTVGIVSSLNRSLAAENGNNLEGLIQTDAAINPGNSGGPLLDSQGAVIGINTAIYNPQGGNGGEAGNIGIGFAIPINRAKEKLEEFRATGTISHPVLGVTQVILVQGDVAEELNLPRAGGLLIEGIDEGSPASAAGLRGPNRMVIVGMYRLGIGGDLIVAIDGQPVETQDALQRAMNQKRPGDKISLTVFRGNRNVKVDVTLGSAPDAQ